MNDEQILPACLAARAALERCEADGIELPFNVRCALDHLNHYLFDRDLKQMDMKFRELSASLGAVLIPLRQVSKLMPGEVHIQWRRA
jgi:hypothetical protein